jgi:hypothetical protein
MFVMVWGCQPWFGARWGGGGSWGFLKGMQASQVTTVGSPTGGLTHHCGSPAVSEPSEGKVMYNKSLGGPGTGEKVQEQNLW